ncbi:MAG: DUF4340 domain-containing protein [Acidobacteriota bacterium]|jgi:hypothetical protein|nr:DUF4340 domain-containing protein [Acidobacteriota bacterium]
MRFKGTLALLLVVIVFGGYIYFYEYKGGAEREAAKKTENQIWRFDAGDIVRVDLTTPDAAMIAEREDGQWTITSPHLWRAEIAELDRLVSSAATLNREGVVEENATNLAQFGLAPASLSLRMKAKDGKEYGIDFGFGNPSGNSIYSALAGSAEVFLVASSASADFGRKPEAFRDRKVFKFERAGVQGVILRNPKGVVRLEKDKDDRWWFAGSEKREAGGAEVREMLNALDLGKIAEFFDDDVDQYENATLDAPMIDVVLTFGPDKALKRFVIGPEKSTLKKKGAQTAAQTTTEGETPAPADREMFLARDDSRPELFFADKELVDKLSLSASDLRDKALVSFQRWDVDGIELENSKGRFQFVKTDGDWVLQGSKRKAKWDEINGINGILDALEKPVKKWIDDPASLANYGMEQPTIRIVLKKGSETIAECRFGASTPDGVYAKVSGDSSIKVADPEGLELLDKAEADYLER